MKEQQLQHPRPQFMRKNWQSLNGSWDFTFDDDNKGILEKWYNGFPSTHKIQVPYTYETKLSGIHDQSHHKVVWYQKEFQIEDIEYTLYFEGVDYTCQVWLNGHKIGEHTGAYERFSYAINEYARPGVNQLIVRVEDSLDCEQPRGKQRWLKDNFGCWYVQTTGIWKSVWLEGKLSRYSLDSVKMTPNLDRDQIIFEPRLKNYAKHLSVPKIQFKVEVTFDGIPISDYQGSIEHQMTPVVLDTRVKEDASWGTKVWEPDHPNLYEVTFKLYDEEGQLLDEVFSYFGMRKISIENGQILLNNRNLYQRLILDQGYWEESGLTPPSVEALEKDINRIQEMGYNGLRKHQKIEDERFIYLCDKKGLLVWVEMPSTYVFNDQAIENLTDEWLQIVRQHYNHPAVITWVPFNESWGIKGVMNHRKPQQFTEGIYHLTKSIDSERPVITNDGWEHTVSDILTLHDYEEYNELFSERYQEKEEIVNNGKMFNQEWFAFANGYDYQGQPIIISEFGGIAFTTEEEESWGYGHEVKDQAQFLKRFDSMHQAIQKLPYISGYCYTQLTDVEQEVNGLLDVHREPKVDLLQIKEINQQR